MGWDSFEHSSCPKGLLTRGFWHPLFLVTQSFGRKLFFQNKPEPQQTNNFFISSQINILVSITIVQNTPIWAVGIQCYLWSISHTMQESILPQKVVTRPRHRDKTLSYMVMFDIHRVIWEDLRVIPNSFWFVVSFSDFHWVNSDIILHLYWLDSLGFSWTLRAFRSAILIQGLFSSEFLWGLLLLFALFFFVCALYFVHTQHTNKCINCMGHVFDLMTLFFTALCRALSLIFKRICCSYLIAFPGFMSLSTMHCSITCFWKVGWL